MQETEDTMRKSRSRRTKKVYGLRGWICTWKKLFGLQKWDFVLFYKHWALWAYIGKENFEFLRPNILKLVRRWPKNPGPKMFLCNWHAASASSPKTACQCTADAACTTTSVSLVWHTIVMDTAYCQLHTADHFYINWPGFPKLRETAKNRLKTAQNFQTTER